MWGWINGWLIKNRAARTCQLFRATRHTDLNQSDWRRLESPDSCTLKVFTQNVNLPISIWLYSTKIGICLHFSHTIETAFMNANNSLTLGLYGRLMTCFVPWPCPKLVINLRQSPCGKLLFTQYADQMSSNSPCLDIMISSSPGRLYQKEKHQSNRPSHRTLLLSGCTIPMTSSWSVLMTSFTLSFLYAQMVVLMTQVTHNPDMTLRKRNLVLT